MSFKDWSLTVDGVRHDFAPVEIVSWSIAGRQYRTDDTDRPRADGRYFGQDFVTPGDIELELIIRVPGTDREERFSEAMAIRETFNTFWAGDTIRFTPGEVADLEIAGRAIVQGRPRHVDWDDSLATFGTIKGTALFVRMSESVYNAGDSWESVTVGLVPPQLGGIVAPLVAPISTAVTSTRARPFTVGGAGPVWPIIEVHGPIGVGARVELTNAWALELNRGLAYDEVARIDTRPDARSMTLNGRPMNLLAPTGSRLSVLSIKPGLNEIALRGTSLEGTAQVTVSWRETRKAI